MSKSIKLLATFVLVVLVCVMSMTACDSVNANGLFGNNENPDNQTSESCAHEYSDWIKDETASCYSSGYEHRICSICGNTEEKTVAPYLHDWEYLQAYEAAGETEGTLVFSACKLCGVTGIVPLELDVDTDGDEISNGEEIEIGTNFLKKDTDGDGLTDWEEINTYKTNPLLADTDGDGASDKRELELEFDPLTFNASFEITFVPIIDNSEKEDTVKPSIEVELNGNQVDSLVIERNDFFDESTLGYVGDAYKYDVDGSFSSAKVGFEFNEGAFTEDSIPTIYAYDEEKGTMKPLATNVEGNVATTEVSEFSTFVLLDRSVYETELKWVDVWGVGDRVYTDIEIIFVIDDSGSMTSNDRYNERLSVAKTLIEKLPDGSKIGIVEFDSSTRVHTASLTSDKNEATSYLTTSYFKSSGGTYMYEAIISALNLFESESDTTMKVMVVLSDGNTGDTSYHSSTITKAQNADVNIYTVGLGSSTSYFTNYLKPLAEKTGGNFYLSSNAEALAEIYDDIGEKIDLTTDSDADGLSDYYEDNMVIFDGIGYVLDKTNPDTDGDGLLDGEEIKTVIIYSADGKQMTVIGKIYSDPTKVDSDGDGVADPLDKKPLDDKVA